MLTEESSYSEKSQTKQVVVTKPPRRLALNQKKSSLKTPASVANFISETDSNLAGDYLDSKLFNINAQQYSKGSTVKFRKNLTNFS